MRAIGIQILAGSDETPPRLEGVLTDMGLRVISGPVLEPLSDLDKDRTVDAIHRLIERLRRDRGDRDELVGVAIEVPGILHNGHVIHSPPLGWQNFPLDRRFRDIADTVVLVNDANALAVCERDFPDEHGVTDEKHFAVMLVTESGVGCGLVLDGNLYTGTRGMSGEIGHMAVVEDDASGLPCSCGNRGCVQTIVTVSAINQALARRGFGGGYQAAISDPDDPIAAAVFRTAGQHLGMAMSTLVNMLNPSTIVLYGQEALIGGRDSFPLRSQRPAGGAVGHYLGGMLDSMKRHVFERAADTCLIMTRTEKDDRGPLAAAACAIEKAQERLSSRS